MSRARTIVWVVAAGVLLIAVGLLLVESQRDGDAVGTVSAPAETTALAPVETTASTRPAPPSRSVVPVRRRAADAGAPAIATDARAAAKAWRPDGVPAGVHWDKLMGDLRPMLTLGVRECFDGHADDDHVRVSYQLHVAGGWATMREINVEAPAADNPLATCVVQRLRALRLPGGDVDFETPVSDDFVAWEVNQRGR